MLKASIGALLLAASLFFAPSHCRAQDSADSARKTLIKTPPTYPTLARSMNIRGVVKLEVLIAPNGTVKSVSVRGGHPMLAQSAVTAVGHWKFEPAAHETKELIEIKFDPE
ncbi:MAG TPA: energy transducer TonB [Candidatus Sulfotelmatobacter sp.]|nr:energy transducer TonB [Candidatus Sulfotelmatobacter sp.]